MELCHNASVVPLTSIVISSASDQALPIIGVVLREVLPLLEVLLWIGEGRGVHQLPVHPEQVISDQLNPVKV